MPRPPPGPFFSPGGQPAPPGPPASQPQSQNQDPFADLGDLSSSLQGNLQAVWGVQRAPGPCGGTGGGSSPLSPRPRAQPHQARPICLVLRACHRDNPRSRQGWLQSLPPPRRHCRAWGTMGGRLGQECGVSLPCSQGGRAPPGAAFLGRRRGAFIGDHARLSRVSHPGGWAGSMWSFW